MYPRFFLLILQATRGEPMPNHDNPFAPNNNNLKDLGCYIFNGHNSVIDENECLAKCTWFFNMMRLDYVP